MACGHVHSSIELLHMLAGASREHDQRGAVVAPREVPHGTSPCALVKTPTDVPHVAHHSSCALVKTEESTARKIMHDVCSSDMGYVHAKPGPGCLQILCM